MARVALNYLSLTHSQVSYAQVIREERRNKDSFSRIEGVPLSYRVNRHISSPLRRIKGLGRTLFDYESVVRHSLPSMKGREKQRGRKYRRCEKGYNPCQVYTAHYLSSMCLKKWTSRNAHSSYRALSTASLSNTLKSVTRRSLVRWESD